MSLLVLLLFSVDKMVLSVIYLGFAGEENSLPIF